MISQAQALNADQPLFSRLWGSGFLPSNHQGVRFRAGSDPVLYLTIRRASTRARAATCSTRPASSTACTSTSSAIPKSKRASRSTRWRSACRPPCRICSIFRRSRRRTFDLYGPDARKPGHLRRELPAGAAPAGARRAFRAALPSRLGPAQRPAARPRAAVQRHRPGLARRW